MTQTKTECIANALLSIRIVFVLILLFFTTAVYIDAQIRAKPSSAFTIEKKKTEQVILVPFRADDPYKGPLYAKVTIIDFSEFQCPACKRALPTLKEIQATYSNSVKIVWKHQPLTFHSNAFPAAEAAEAAREQGKFWEMHDLLFQNQRQLSPAKFEELAATLGLDMEKFKASLAERRNKIRIQEDASLGRRTGAIGTPTFFINGRRVVGAHPLETFKKIVDEELARADQLLKAGVQLDANFYKLIVEANKNYQNSASQK